MRLVWKLLRSHLSVVQMAGFMLTNLVGVAIILTSVQLYRDVRPALSGAESLLDGDHLIISKKVTGGRGAGFTSDEVDSLRRLPAVSDIGGFSTAQYGIIGSLAMAGAEMSTYLFFEAVPDVFIDVESADWRFADGDGTIPVILPKNYLNLYNFGFAQSQGLPQISPELVQMVGFEITLRGNGRVEEFDGRIVGFSNRLNTILVPQSFLEWSNDRFGSGEPKDPSRLILEVANTTDAQLNAYLASHGYEIEGDAAGGRTAYLLRLATGVVIGIGLLITALSIFVLMLSVFLLLQKNTRKLEDLLMLGFTPGEVSRPYRLLTLGLNMLVLAAAVSVVLWARSVYMPLAEGIVAGATPACFGVTLLYGLAIVVVITALNWAAIGRKVRSLWRQQA